MLKKNLFKFYFTFIIVFTLIGFSYSAKAESLNDNEPYKYVSVKIFADKTNIIGGETIRLAIEQTIYPDWHTYWLNPGDSGLPFEVEWNLPKNYHVGNLEWPTPQKIKFGELTNYGYEKKVVLLQNLNIPKNISTNPITIKGKANLLVCHDICIPETHDIQITLNGDETANKNLIETAKSKIPVTLNQESFFYEEGENFIIDIIGKETSFNQKNVYIAPEEWGLIDNNANAKVKITNDGYRITQKRGDRSLSKIKEFSFIINDKRNAYSLTALPSLNKSTTATTDPTNELTNNTVENQLTFTKAFLFALLGGIILNLMPCVFPVLSMKALSLVQLSGKEEEKARLYGLSYTAGILISFGLIAAILIGLKTAGAQIGWGFQLQSPIVISLLAYLVFIIGLNLSGFFEFKIGFTNAGQKLASQSGNKGAFFTGVLATLVATPCTAPFMGAAMGYALTQSAFSAILIFLALGFGLALPYLALCFIPSLRTKLPKPGAWMETFKQFLSFPMFLTAAFLIWVLSQQAGSLSVLCILSSMVAIVFIIWLWRVIPKQGLVRLISLMLLGLAIIFVIATPLLLKTEMQVTSPNTQNEQVYNAQKLSELLKGNDPIFTNMTAAWCITCKINERVAIKTQEVQNIFAEKNIQYLKGDWTNQNPEITQYLNSFGRQGVPLYVYYGARDVQNGERPSPVLLPQILTVNLIKNTVQ